MAFIYKITNDINNKIYIGKTILTIEERWLEHLRDYQKITEQNRPLYKAMIKYGKEHFHIEEVEKVENINELSDREKYWIENYQSFKYGYNATKGGDGKPYLDYDLIISTYIKVKNIKQVAKLTGAHPDSITAILKNANINIIPSSQVLRENYSKKVACYKNDIIIKSFSSLTDAAKWIIKNKYSKSQIIKGVIATISHAAKGKLLTAYGFTWFYL